MQRNKRLMTVTVTALWLCYGAILTQSARAADAPPPAPAAATTPAATGEDKFPPEQIEQLVAPVALYPDALLAQLLMASTYPLDIVQADRWLDDHQSLEGENLEKAATQEDWDPSVQSLVFFPTVLGYMSDNLNWTQDLGDAVLAQQKDVIHAIQRLREEAETAGTLKSTEQQIVEAKGDTIVIQPADPEVVYVPSYNPATIYGQTEPPATTYYPSTYTTPVYQAPVETSTSSSSTDSLISFGVGAIAGGLLTAAIMWDDDDDDHIWYGGPGYYGRRGYWGGSNYWNEGWRQPNNINIERGDITRTVERGDITVNKGIVGNEVKQWQHNPEHRGGVRYRSQETRSKFDGSRRNSLVDSDTARGRQPARLTDSDLKRPAGAGTRPQSKRSAGGAKRSTSREAKVQKPKVRKPKAQAKRQNVAKAKPARRSGGQASGFRPQKGGLDRAASRRGAASRSGGTTARARTSGSARAAAGGGGRAARSGGGGRAAGGGRRR